MLDKIEAEGLLERSRAVGETIGGRLDAMRERFGAVGDVRGRGAMRAIELVADRATKEPASAETMGAVSRGALERGVIVLTAGTYGNVLRLLPPVTIEDGAPRRGPRPPRGGGRRGGGMSDAEAFVERISTSVLATMDMYSIHLGDRLGYYAR